ncbi:bifunctional methylenetetrahydrofolate dehydrogenase/methenyltetrahydrofolate cyclohydrolase, partial [Paracoccus sp. CPCC 101403]|nr:bifunctional methylenetetrahydrofolate dehydrogenase/methenyltetrahydrofolate cyclohydrolase [Paracoccus sp. CPCC 101403]
MTNIIDGKAFAAAIRGRVADHVTELSGLGIVPGLAVVLVGEDP